ncbi:MULTISPECIES: tetratricopeptide repeat protein [unclassified Ruegeria]|uniref:tetratricopeptide repeat protein n=1 Tax=unclassified Ruegeria TaxID=2625375 RepID=UPI001488B5FA|nr:MULTISPECIES: tetratricopeptide repeat protein [unclassified Ruegeria]
MIAMPQERKLTTILSADVVGYSAMMNRDESGTLASLKELRRNLIEPKIEQYHGRTIKLMGDGTLMEFSSVFDAVCFAVDIQHKVDEFNASRDEEPILYRIGINVGDIIVDEEDIYGDGVNIAARLEALSDPGGICLSGSVMEHIAGKLDLDITPLGERLVKNIPTPILIYKVERNAKAASLSTPMLEVQSPPSKRQFTPWIAAVILAVLFLTGLAVWQPWKPEFARASVDRMALPLPDKPSLVVLPFEDFSDSKENEYFADGMTEDLITDLSKISGIFVISRNSSWTYKDKAVRSQQVAEELGVQYILEGSVRRAGDQVRVNAQLIDALGGHHIWADRYDSQIEDVFALQDQVLREITTALAVQLTAIEEGGLERAETESPLAYDAVLRGLDLLRRDNEDATAEAISAFEKAIELDPDYSRAYAGLAAAHWRIVQSVWFLAAGGGFERSWREVLKNIDKAMEAPSALAYSLKAQILVEQGRHSEAFDELDKALALSPSDPDIHVAKAKVLNATGRAAEAEAALRYAVRFDPLQTTRYLRELGVAQLHQRKYREAVSTMRRVIARENDSAPDIMTLVSALGHLNETDEVPALIEKYNEIAVPSFYDPFTAQESLLWWYGDMFGYDPEYRQHLFEGLVKAGVPEGAGSDLKWSTVRELVSQSEGLYSVEDVRMISTEEAHELWRNNAAVFVDVRAELDFDAGHIPGAHFLSLMVGLSREALMEIASKDDTLIFSCHGPHCPYSAYAAAKAQLWGFEEPRYYPGGFPAWQEAGLPTETTESQQ